MKKILVFISMFILTLSVNASINTTETTIKVTNVLIETNESVGYNEEFEITYTINPGDATNKTLDWEVISNGVETTLSNDTTTNLTGKLTIKVLNNNEESTKITLVVKQNGNELATKEITVETKEETIDKTVSEVEKLITDLDTEIDNDNYEETKESIEVIEKKLTDEVKDKVSAELLAKYENVKTSVNEFTPSNNTLVTIITIALVIIFTGLLFWIFNKED